MRRALAVALVGLSAIVLSGCAGGEADRASKLLARSSQAMDDVRSVSFSGRVWTDGGGGVPPFAVDLEGGLYTKGKRAGDMFAEATVEGVPAAFSVVVLNGVTSMREAAGPWRTMPTAARKPLGVAGRSDASFGGFDVARYIRDVSVREGEELRGERVTKIAGVLDTGALADGMLAEMGSLMGPGEKSLRRASSELGNARVAVWISEKTHRVKALLVDVAAKEADGSTTHVHLALAFKRLDKPVAIPETA